MSRCEIVRVAKTGGTAVVLAMGYAYPNDIVIDSTSLYFAELRTGKGDSNLKNQNQPMLLNALLAWDIALDGATIYSASNGGVFSVPAVGGQETNLATATDARRVAMDSKYLYWADYATGIRVLTPGSEAGSGASPSKRKMRDTAAERVDRGVDVRVPDVDRERDGAAHLVGRPRCDGVEQWAGKVEDDIGEGSWKNPHDYDRGNLVPPS